MQLTNLEKTFKSHQQKDQSLEKCFIMIRKVESVFKKLYPLEPPEQTNKVRYDTLLVNSIILEKNSGVVSTDIIEPETKSQASYKDGKIGQNFLCGYKEKIQNVLCSSLTLYSIIIVIYVRRTRTLLRGIKKYSNKYE